MKPVRVILLDQDPERRKELATLLRGADHYVDAVADASTSNSKLETFDALLIGLDAPDLDLTALQQAIAPRHPAEPESLEAAERRHLAQVLRHTAGNKRRAALLLGISRSTLLNKVRKYGLAVMVLLAGLFPAADTGLLAQVGRPIPGGRVTSGMLSFDGHATVGDFVGSTTSVSGEFTGAPDISAVSGWVQAPVKTLTTRNGKRDKDLNKSMESDKYPDLRFELTGISPKGGSADSLAVMLHGKLLLHGVTRTVALPATLHIRGSEARVRSDFSLNLKDYRVGGLSKMLGVLKMYDNIEVHVDLLFGLVSSAPVPAHPGR